MNDTNKYEVEVSRENKKVEVEAQTLAQAEVTAMRMVDGSHSAKGKRLYRGQE